MVLTISMEILVKFNFSEMHDARAEYGLNRQEICIGCMEGEL